MTKLALVFPGQGSQTVGMLSELHSEFATVRDTFDEASKALGYDLWALVANGPLFPARAWLFSSVATRAVQPVWWLAPSPFPSSALKYS